MPPSRPWVRFTAEPGRETGSGYKRNARLVVVNPAKVAGVEEDARGNWCALRMDAGAIIMVACSAEGALEKLGVDYVSD